MEFNTKRMKIPLDAPLSEVIIAFNFMHLEVDPEHKDPEWQKWLYDHKDWLVDNEV